jgi:hypothetical protein
MKTKRSSLIEQHIGMAGPMTFNGKSPLLNSCSVGMR